MSDVSMQTTPAVSFTIRITVSQLIDPFIQLPQLDGTATERQPKKQPLKGKAEVKKDQQKQSSMKKGQREHEDDEDDFASRSSSAPLMDSSSVLTIPLLVSIDEVDYGLLVQHEDVEIQLKRTYSQVIEGGVANGVRLVS